MDADLKQILWWQVGASLDTLENALVACPEELWGDRTQRPEYWYMVFHTLFFLDLYTFGTVEGFAPPAPFTLDEMDPAGILPERVYTKAELQAYLHYCRDRLRAAIGSLTDESAARRCAFGWGAEMSYLEFILYSLRHMQHHSAQLNLLLRQKYDTAPGWVGRTKVSLY